VIIGVPKEIKTNENRVAVVPAGVETLVSHGHTVKVERGAGIGSGFSDEQYAKAGAKLVPAAADAWDAEMVCKVKEPIRVEWPHMKILCPGRLCSTNARIASAHMRKV